MKSRIQHALVALYGAEESLPPNEPGSSKLRLEFNTQIVRLRTKLTRIAGPACMQEFDRAHPRLLALSSPSSKAPSPSAAAPEAQPSQAPQQPQLRESLRGPMPGRLSNEQLAHELALDRSFQLEDGGGCRSENPLLQQIRDRFHRAFWDSLVGDLCLETPCYARVLHVVADIRDGLHDLSVRASRPVDVQQVIDLDYIRRQAELGLYNWQDCLCLIATIFGVVQQV